MRRVEFCAVFLGIFALAGCQVWQIFEGEFQRADEMLLQPFQSVQILSWNVHGCRGTDGVVDVARVADAIDRAGVDVVAVQDLDRKTKRAKGIDQLAELEKKTGLTATWGLLRAEDEGETGLAVLSKTAPTGVHRVVLPPDEGADPSVLLLAEFADYTVGVVHFSASESRRLSAIDALRVYAAAQKPFFLVGDWNVEPESATVQAIRSSFAIVSGRDATFPSPKPEICLDYVAVSRRHRARFGHVSHDVLPESAASDHRPVSVTLR